MAVPHLDGVLADEAVPPEDLHAVVGDLHALLGRVGSGQMRAARGVEPLLELARCLPHQGSVPTGGGPDTGYQNGMSKNTESRTK